MLRKNVHRPLFFLLLLLREGGADNMQSSDVMIVVETEKVHKYCVPAKSSKNIQSILK